MRNTDLNFVDNSVKYTEQIEVYELNNKLTCTYAYDIRGGPKISDILFKKSKLDEE